MTAPADDYSTLDREDEQRRERLTAPGALADAAAWYAATGWPVFPLRPTGKTPLTTHGFKDASTDLGVIRDWWAKTPAANIGTPTGIRFDVIDVDGPAGFRSVVDMRHINCPADCCATTTCRPPLDVILGHPVLAVAYTGGGGRHLLIPPTGQGNGARIAAGVDYRGRGGFIVVPPSVHTSGRYYDWITPPDGRLAA